MLSCRTYENASDEPVMAEVVFKIEGSDLSGSNTDLPGRMESRNAYVSTVLIGAVPASTTTDDIGPNMTLYSQSLMDLDNNTVSLTIPYDTSLKLIYISFFSSFTLAEAMVQDSPNYLALSDTFTISAGTSTETIQITPIATRWQGTMQFGTTAIDMVKQIMVADSGDIYVSGETYGDLSGTNAGLSDLYLTKYDSSGNRLWTTQTGSTLAEQVTGMSTDSTGDIYISGTWGFDESDSNTYDGFVAKFSYTTGSLIKKIILGSSGQQDIIKGVVVDGSDNVYVTGMTDGSSFNGESKTDSVGKFDTFVSRYDSGLNHVWTVFIDSAGDADDYAFGIDVCGMGYVYVAGSTSSEMPGNSSLGDTDSYVAQLDPDGNIQWIKQFGGSDTDEANAIAVSRSTANIFITGRTKSDMEGNTNLGGWDSYITSYSNSGAKRWTSAKWISTTGNEEALDIALDLYDYVYAVGYTESSLPGNTSQGGIDGFIYRWDDSGTVSALSQNQIGDASEDALTSVYVSNDREIFIGGTSKSAFSRNWTPLGDWDGLIMQLDASGDEL